MEKFQNISLRITPTECDGDPITRLKLTIEDDTRCVTVADGYGNLSENFLSSDKAAEYFKLFAASPLLVDALKSLLDFPDEDLTAWANGTEPVTITLTPWHIKTGISALAAAGITFKTVEDEL